MAANLFARHARRSQILSREVRNLLICPRCTALVPERGIKRVPNKPRRKDGHETTSYNLYWEDRLQNVPRPPLWIQPEKADRKSPANKTSRSFTTAEKRPCSKQNEGAPQKELLENSRIAATAVITMLAAVISFKIVFGNKEKKVTAESDSSKLSAQQI